MASIPSGGHSDWFFGLFAWLPRKLTAVAGPPPTDIVYSPNFDKVHNHPDVPNKGAWAVSVSAEHGVSFAAVVKGPGGWWLIAIGSFRYDYVGMYYTMPRLAIKRVK